MKRLIGLLLALGLCFLTPAASPAAPVIAASSDPATVHLLDVGQGDAILIRSPEGKVALIDAGPSKNIVKLLQDQRVTSIDLVVVSHHHADHIGGMDDVIKTFKPKVYLDSGSSHTSATYKRLLEAVRDAGTQYVRAEPRRINLGSVVLTVFPLPPEDRDEENNNSVGLRVQYGSFSVLLTGDSEERERAWWKQHAQTVPFADITALKLAHHGSRNGTDREWLRATKPRLAVASLGKGNSYRHPHQETLDALVAERVPLLRTDEHGTVTIESDGKAWRVVTPQNAARAPPGAPADGEAGDTGLAQTDPAPAGAAAAPVTQAREAVGVVGTKGKSEVYHSPTCGTAGNIKPENRIWWQDPKKSNRRACEKCGGNAGPVRNFFLGNVPAAQDAAAPPGGGGGRPPGGGGVPEPGLTSGQILDAFKKMKDADQRKLVDQLIAEMSADGKAALRRKLGVQEQGKAEPLDLNEATPKDLAKLGVPQDVAEAIVEAAPFDAVADLIFVEGVTKELLQKIRPYLTVRKNQ
jgi:beta-lactamase superfamily II metal-dependent hydrolase